MQCAQEDPTRGSLQPRQLKHCTPFENIMSLQSACSMRTFADLPYSTVTEWKIVGLQQMMGLHRTGQDGGTAQ